MRSRLLIDVAAALLVATGSMAAAQDVADPAAELPDEAPPIAEEGLPHGVFRPCLGAGYVPYAYPAFGTCPCAEDGCFPAAPYFACGRCGEAYRERWLKKWARAHFGHASMLDGYPCHCILPTAGRPYVARIAVSPGSPTPPPPAPTRPD